MRKFLEISFITFLASIIISIASGYCTVVGMGNIFTSAPFMTMLIAAVIEFGRVVLVYDLHHFWHIMPAIKKIPGILMLLIAMSLSALGVFGFFSNAYAEKTNQVIPIELEIKQLEAEIPLLTSEIDLNTKQIEDIQKTMNSKSVDSAMEKFIEKEYVTKALNVKKDMQKQISTLMSSNKELNQKVIDIKKQITEKQIDAESKAPTIAHLKYLAQLLGTTNDKAIIIFIVMIMMVFDTLAMYLMITSDWIKTLGEEKKPVELPKEEPIEKPIETPSIKDEIKETIGEMVKDIDVKPIVEKETKVKEEVIEKPKETKIPKNNIDLKVSHLVQLLREDPSLIDKKSFIDSLRITPLVVQKLGEELGDDNELMVKIRAKIKNKR